LLQPPSYQSAYGTRRLSNAKLLGIGAVVLLHVIFLWALQNGTARQSLEKIKKVVEAKIIEEIKPKIEPPPPPPPPPPPKQVVPPQPPKLKPPEPTPQVKPPPKVEQVPAQVPVAIESPTPPVSPVVAAPAPVVPAPVPPIAQPVTPPPPPVAAPAPARPAVRTAATQITGSCERPTYPIISKRAGEEGRVVLEFVIGVDGRVLQSKIASSSGFPRLDEAARSALSKCQFSPATVDGQPVQASTKQPFVWELE
jgi:periplasmic protein TonB